VQLEKYFEAAPTGKASALCEAFGVEYAAVHSMSELVAALPDFYEATTGGGARLLEIYTPAGLNDKVLKQFFRLYAELNK
jgi:2-succinyl-5-enolpyruvyl-6-hydroxy-3-cyclohexene-1-carboxylate synthase